MATPYLKTSTSQNAINIVFDPRDSKVASDCAKIVSIQFVRIDADGSNIMPGTYSDVFKYKDQVTTDALWYVDFLDGETTPDYQQNDGKAGYINIGGAKDCTMYDAPNTAGGNKGFYDKNSNPDGWKKVVYEFVTYSWCMDSSKEGQCNTWYEALSWTYTKTSEDHAAKRPGLAKVVDDDIAPPIKDEFLAAFNKFNTVFGYVPCANLLKAIANAGGVS